MPKVYIPNRGSHNYSDAERFGDLSFVSSGLVNPFNTGQQFRMWELALRDSSPEDRIVISSLPVLCTIGGSLYAYKHGKLNLLIFSSEGKYQPREINYENVERNGIRISRPTVR